MNYPAIEAPLLFLIRMSYVVYTENVGEGNSSFLHIIALSAVGKAKLRE